MSGLEVAFLSCIGVNSTINIIQSASGLWTSIKRWFRLRTSRLVTMSKYQNEQHFFKVSKMLNSICCNLKLRSIVSFGNEEKSYSFWIPDPNTEVQLKTKYGNVCIKAIARDNYTIDAYEITCSTKQFYAIDRLMIALFEEMCPAMPLESLNEHKKCLNVDAINDEKYKLKETKTCSRPWCPCDNGWYTCPHQNPVDHKSL